MTYWAKGIIITVLGVGVVAGIDTLLPAQRDRRSVVGDVPVHVLRKERVGPTTFYTVESVLPTKFRFRVEEGLVGQDDKFFACKQVSEWRDGPQGVMYPSVVLECPERGIKMVLVEMDMTAPTVALWPDAHIFAEVK